MKLSELIEALELQSDQVEDYLDLQTGRVVHIWDSLMSAVQEGDDEALEGLEDWEREGIEDAKAIVADSGERFVAAPDKFDFHEYPHMEGFIETLEDRAAAEQLWRAIKGKGAFRYFKDTARRLGLLDQWYKDRDDAIKQHVLAWAEKRQIPLVDDTARSPKA